MKVRKLNGGDNRGHIFTVRDFRVQVYTNIEQATGKLILQIKEYLELESKAKGVGGDGASIYEVLPPDTPETTWEDEAYKSWIAEHTHSENHCDDCGKAGNIIHDKWSGTIRKK